MLALAGGSDHFVLEDGVDSIRRCFFDPPFRLVLVGPSECGESASARHHFAFFFSAGKSTFVKSLFASLPKLLPIGYFKRVR